MSDILIFAKPPAAAPPPRTAKLMAIRRSGLKIVGVDGPEGFPQPFKYLPLYVVTYQCENLLYEVPVEDTGKGGFVALVTQAVRLDAERRRYLEDRSVHLKLPMEIVL